MFPIVDCRANIFPGIHEIPDRPKQLWMRGTLPPEGNRFLSVVGSRNYTNYGKECVQHLIGGLRGYPVTIISGLALGIDALAHEAALNAGLHTIAIPGSGLDDSVLYPRTNRGLASRILNEGGMLMSEFESNTRSAPWMFPARNRIIAALADAVLVIEAAERSGTLITARLAGEYGKELFVVPGSIFSKNTKGAHQFLKLGATPVTCAEDIRDALHLPAHENAPAAITYDDGTPEATVLHLLREPTAVDEVIRNTARKHTLDIAAINTLLMRMEFAGEITTSGGIARRAV